MGINFVNIAQVTLYFLRHPPEPIQASPGVPGSHFEEHFLTKARQHHMQRCSGDGA